MGYGWSINHPTARKAHRCEMCARRIDVGERHLRGAGFDGTAWSWRECAHCEAVRKMYDINDGNEYNEDMFDVWADDPQDVPELRHAVGYRMRWRTRLGTLLPVPESQELPTTKEKTA